MKGLTALSAITALIVFSGNALAVPPGKAVEFAGGGHGKVIFDGKLHHDRGFQCANCHTKVFQMRKGANKITMSGIASGRFCGECHNGTKAFKASDTGNCAKCHKK